MSPASASGNADDARLASGVTAIVFDEPAVAAVDVRGGAPGTRETDLLEPHRTVERIDAVVLSGGSAFGLDAASGVQAFLRETRPRLCDRRHPHPDRLRRGAVRPAQRRRQELGPLSALSRLGYAAAAAAGETFALGTAGAGFGATTVNLKGGLGSASAVTRDGHMVGALVAVNACGSVNVGRGPHFWAAPFESTANSAVSASRQPCRPKLSSRIAKGRPGENTTIAIVATDATLTKAQTKQLAVMAQDGLARAIYPAHTTLDGDTVFAAATGRRPLGDAVNELTELGAVAANALGARGRPRRVRGQGPPRRYPELARLPQRATFAPLAGGVRLTPPRISHLSRC